MSLEVQKSKIFMEDTGIFVTKLKEAGDGHFKEDKILKLSDDGTKVRRITPIKEIDQEETDSKRTNGDIGKVPYEELVDYLRKDIIPDGLTRSELLIFRKKAKNFKLVKGGLYFCPAKRQNVKPRKVLKTEKERQDALKAAHGDQHASQSSMEDVLKKDFFWQTMTDDIGRFLVACCQPKLLTEDNADEDTEKHNPLLEARMKVFEDYFAGKLLNNPLPVKSEDKPGKFPNGNKTLNRLQKLAPAKTDQDSNEENVSDDKKTDASQNKTAATSKKKKHTKKKKATDSTSDESNLKLTVTELEPCEKKEQTKGKKKKKKQNQLADGMASKEKEKCPCVEPGAPDLTDLAGLGSESIADVDMPEVQSETVQESSTRLHEACDSCELDKSAAIKLAEDAGSKKKKKKKRRGDKKKQLDKNKGKLEDLGLQARNMDMSTKIDMDENVNNADESTDNADIKLSRKERKRLRQEDIRRKKLEREQATTNEATTTPTIPQVDEVNASRDVPAGHVEAAAEEPNCVFLQGQGQSGRRQMQVQK